MRGLVYSPIIAGICLAVALVGWRGNALLRQSAYEEVEVEDGGTIRGVVRLVDDVSTAEDFEVTKDHDYCGAKKPSPRLRVGEANEVQNAVVSIEGIARGKGFASDATPSLSQRECEYEPHVLILPVGQQLEIVNNDPILHNVHGYDLRRSRPRSIFNIAQPIQGQRILIKAKRFRAPGLVLATCDGGHAWMSAYIVVAEHPYYALTDANGEFTLDDVPPGPYRLRLWHEGVAVTETSFAKGKPKRYYFEEPYELTKDVIVPPNGETTVEFELQLRER